MNVWVSSHHCAEVTHTDILKSLPVSSATPSGNMHSTPASKHKAQRVGYPCIHTVKSNIFRTKFGLPKQPRVTNRNMNNTQNVWAWGDLVVNIPYDWQPQEMIFGYCWILLDTVGYCWILLDTVVSRLRSRIVWYVRFWPDKINDFFLKSERHFSFVLV